MYIQYQIYNIFVSIASHNTTIKCIKNRRLYKESTHLHAVHDADLLKKVRNRSDGSDNYTKSLPERVMTRLQAGAFNIDSSEMLSLEDYLQEYFTKMLLCLVDINFEAVQKQKNLII